VGIVSDSMSVSVLLVIVAANWSPAVIARAELPSWLRWIVNVSAAPRARRHADDLRVRRSRIHTGWPDRRVERDGWHQRALPCAEDDRHAARRRRWRGENRADGEVLVRVERWHRLGYLLFALRRVRGFAAALFSGAAPASLFSAAASSAFCSETSRSAVAAGRSCSTPPRGG
jgi:hypothetical protein